MEVFKIAGFALLGVLLAVVLKQGKPEYGMFISMCVCVVIFSFLLVRMQAVLRYLEQLEQAAGMDDIYLETVLKMLGITYVSQLASDICKDAGHSAVAGQIDLFARISILFLSFPILSALVDTIGALL